ncbi:30S ribosomal protein S6 [Membranicola marinus]|uniref:Small ribosomal subunit protein bS6 n=1 Tax=Membranihabitans marinus TaxID=1227546 RepID=A0A953LAB0_9BACT|nr:30S ribosomal protein S6 [Membranihabitans marinus]MBY5958513.1 30S ribosomal protein S6 [Membranihabitans marinus]
MRTYEVTFIVDPVLSTEEIKSTAQNYVDHLKSENCNIVDLQDIGLRQLAYPINKRSTGVYYSLEFTSETGEIVKKLELALKRDERVIRYLLIKLDKFAVQYNDDKRNGRIGKSLPKEENAPKEEQPKKAAKVVAGGEEE